jgi:hypothetical protein
VKRVTAIVGAVVLLGGAAGISWLVGGDTAIRPQVRVLPAAASAATTPTAPVPTSSGASTAAAMTTPHASAWRDRLAGATDLRSIYERNIASSDPTERAAAWRAWSACMPAFLGSPTQAATPETLAAAIPPGPDSGARIEALRSLYARCQGFVNERRDDQSAEAARTLALHGRGDARSHAESAQALLNMGDREGTLKRVAESVAAGDPY